MYALTVSLALQSRPITGRLLKRSQKIKIIPHEMTAMIG